MGLLALVLVAAAVPFWTRDSDWTPQPVLKSVPADLLESHGIHLARAATTGHLPVSRAEAEEMTREHWPGITVREAVLARVETENHVSDGCLCWVVSSMPAGGIMISGPMPLTDADATARAQYVAELRAGMHDQYHIDVIDATTGRWLFASEGARVP